MHKFLSKELPQGGVNSVTNSTNPPKSSLIFITTLVNQYKIKILIDTGATTTFINEKTLRYMSNLTSINKSTYSFTLADGIAPFHVLGVVKLSIQFSNSLTSIQAHVARQLCADMIIGMDYINQYNLTINIEQQTISINNNNRTFSMNIDKEYALRQIPVTISKPLFIPPHSNRSTRVSIPISSICSSFVPTSNISNQTSLITKYTFLKFQKYFSHITFSNTSSKPQFLSKGIRVGFLFCRSDIRDSHSSPRSLHKSVGITESFGSIPALLDLYVTQPIGFTSFGITESFGSIPALLDLYVTQPIGFKSFGITESFGNIPALDDLSSDRYPNSKLPITDKVSLGNNNLLDNTNTNSFCNAIQFKNPVVDENIRKLVDKIENKQQQDNLHSLLLRYRRTFDATKHTIANTSIQHVINTIPHSPPACRPYPQPDKEEAMYKLVQEFLKAGLIQESHSPYAAPAILVKKGDGSYRFVVDYKRLNLITIKDSSPLPNMEDTIQKLGRGYTYFSKLDLKSGFYQIPIHKGDKEKTAFVTPFGLYQFNVLPMGLKNSPPTFQKVMTDTLQSCRNFSLVYLDDIIVFSKTYDEHLQHLSLVLSALQAKNLVLNPPKCELAVHQIDYLGHTISSKRITPMKDKITAILQVAEPRSLAQANRFIGALSWYRKFIPHFATVAAPIHAVTNLTKSNRHKFRWRFLQSKAFQELKRLLTTAPLFLHYPVPNKPLILTTDASGIGVGGVLQQEVDGEIHNLYYHSQLMTTCERRYSTIEKEALAIYKCCVRMRPFLLGRSITLMTDHCPLCHIMEKTVKNARVDRITHLIQEYSIEKVIHIKGRENCLPDFLSRYSRGQDDDLFEVEYGLASKDEVLPPKSCPIHNNFKPSTSSYPPNTQVLAAMKLRPRHNKQKSMSATTFVDDDAITNEAFDHGSLKDVPQTSRISSKFSHNYFDITKLKEEQDNDTRIQQIIKQLESKSHTVSCVIKDNLLYKLITPSRNSKRKLEVIYLPTSMIQTLIKACHDDPMTGAHFSTDRTYYKIKNQYWWPGMKYMIKQHIRSCLLCQQYNISRQKKHGQLRPMAPPEGPFVLIGIDYCGPFKITPRENQYVLVITDYFTRHITAIALPNCTAETTAQALFNEYFCKYGIPSVILSDQGSHFQNQLMENIQKLIGYNHIYSTPYHPQTNGIVERFNSTFVPQISKLQDNEDNNWDEYLQAVVFAYNTGVHKTTKYSPYELLYGRLSRLPINTRTNSFTFNRPNDYFEQLRKTLRIYHESARQNIIQQQQINKTWYDRNRLDPHYKIGDKVLSRIYGLRGKLDPKFSAIPKVIVGVKHPIYIVEAEDTHIQSQVHVGDLRPILIE
jgi:hypothetical protein